MRSAAQFFGKLTTADAQNSHVRTVFFAEQRNRTRTYCVFNRHQIRFNRLVLQNIAVDQIFDFRNFFRRQRLIMRKIKPQKIRRNHRTALLDVRAENFLQSRVNQMRRRMIPPRRIAFLHINRRRNFITNFYRTTFDFRLMQNDSRNRRKCIENFDVRVCIKKPARIADLSARFGVKRRFIQND